MSAIQGAVDEAHRWGKPVFVHRNSGADVLAAVRAGADVIAHTTPASDPWDTTMIAAMKGRGGARPPTLSVWKDLLRHERISAQEQSVSTSIRQLRTWVASGGTVLFGNDLGAAGYDPQEEYALMVEAGNGLPADSGVSHNRAAERLFMTKRDHRIHHCGPTCGQVTGQA